MVMQGIDDFTKDHPEAQCMYVIGTIPGYVFSQVERNSMTIIVDDALDRIKDGNPDRQVPTVSVHNFNNIDEVQRFLEEGLRLEAAPQSGSPHGVLQHCASTPSIPSTPSGHGSPVHVHLSMDSSAGIELCIGTRVRLLGGPNDNLHGRLGKIVDWMERNYWPVEMENKPRLIPQEQLQVVITSILSALHSGKTLPYQ